MTHEFTAWHAVIVFLSALFADVAWAHYTMATASKKAKLSALWAGGIILLGAINVEAYIVSPWYIAPAFAGAVIGTYIAVRREEKGVDGK